MTQAEGTAPRAARPEAVVAVLRREDGRVLVIRRGPGAAMSGYWAPPSGKIEPGERQEETLAREVREELGLDVTPLAKVWESVTHDGAFVLHWWTAQVRPGPLTPDPREVSEVRWVTPADYHRLTPTFAGDHPFFDDVLPSL
jgi:mutator protein MutT